MARFFKKFSPSTPVVLAGGQRLSFNTLDNVVGYFSTNDEGVAAQFEGFMRAQRYGLSEITYDEFNTDYLVKKNSGMVRPRQFREELSQHTFAEAARQGAASSAAAGVAVEPAKPGSAAVVADPVTAPVIAPTNPDFKPPTGQRKRKAQTK